MVTIVAETYRRIFYRYGNLLFRFQLRTQPGRNIVQLDRIYKSYGDLHILKNATASIERGDKIALIGANGKGKSTLLRIISGEEKFEGEHVVGHQVESYSYAQHQLESLSVENSVIDELKSMGSTKSETELRSILGCFLFSSDDVFKKIKVLSGGERARVALAKTLVSNPIIRDKEGYICAPEAPGLGIDINIKTVQKYLIDTQIIVNGKTLYLTPKI